MCSRSSQNLEFGHLTLLFAEYGEEMYQNLKRMCRAFVSLILLFSGEQGWRWGAGMALGSRDGAVVEHLPPTQASHQCGPGSIRFGVICGLSLLLVLVLAPRGFSPGTPVFPSPQKPTFPNAISIWNLRTSLKTTTVSGAS